MMAESVNDVATVQRNLQRTVESTEDDLIAQARQTRELQRDLLRTRMLEFESISDRLYRVIRLASKEAGKQVKLDITGGSIEMDRGVLDRMTPAFEHLLRNCVAHGIEDPAVAQRGRQGSAAGTILIGLHYEGNDVSVEFHDDGAGLDLRRDPRKSAAAGPGLAGPAIDRRRGRQPDLHAGLFHRRPGDRAGRSRHRHGRGAFRGQRARRAHRNHDRGGPGDDFQAGAAADHGRDAGGDDPHRQARDRRAGQRGRNRAPGHAQGNRAGLQHRFL